MKKLRTEQTFQSTGQSEGFYCVDPSRPNANAGSHHLVATQNGKIPSPNCNEKSKFQSYEVQPPSWQAKPPRISAKLEVNIRIRWAQRKKRRNARNESFSFREKYFR